MTPDQALDILQAVVDSCRFNRIDAPAVVNEALDILESRSASKWPFSTFRAALALEIPRSTHAEREALWQALYAALNAIRLNTEAREL